MYFRGDDVSYFVGMHHQACSFVHRRRDGDDQRNRHRRDRDSTTLHRQAAIGPLLSTWAETVFRSIITRKPPGNQQNAPVRIDQQRGTLKLAASVLLRHVVMLTCRQLVRSSAVNMIFGPRLRQPVVVYCRNNLPRGFRHSFCSRWRDTNESSLSHSSQLCSKGKREASSTGLRHRSRVVRRARTNFESLAASRERSKGYTRGRMYAATKPLE